MDEAYHGQLVAHILRGYTWDSYRRYLYATTRWTCLASGNNIHTIPCLFVKHIQDTNLVSSRRVCRLVQLRKYKIRPF